MHTRNIRDGPEQRLIRWKDMNVFLSWSGEESKAVAQALYFWLPEVIQTVRPWMSQQDLVAGVRWSNEIEGNLKQSAFGIICVTPSNRSAPWLNFEAGAISNNLGVVNVVPYIFRLGFADLSGPLTQFQGKEATREGTRDVVGALNKSLGEAGLDGRRLEKAFEKLWPDLEAKLEAIPQTPESKASEEEAKGRTEEDKLDEMLLLLRRVASNPIDKLTDRINKNRRDMNSEISEAFKRNTFLHQRVMASFMDKERAEAAYILIRDLEPNNYKNMEVSPNGDALTFTVSSIKTIDILQEEFAGSRGLMSIETVH